MINDRTKATALFIKQNSRKEYGYECLATLVDLVGIEEMLANGLLSIIPPAAKKYFEGHPEALQSYQNDLATAGMPERLETVTAPFLGVNKIKEEEM